MSIELKRIIKIRIILALCVIALLALHSAIVLVDFGKVGNSLSGVIAASELAVCIIMVWTDCWAGYIFALGWQTVSLIYLIDTIFRRHIINAVPGLAHNILYTFVIILLVRLLRKKEHEIYTDVLTGLANKAAVMQKLQDRIDFKRPTSLIYIDLANFHMVNDNFGHDAGDSVIQIVAGRIKAVTPKHCFAARTGSDEFAVIVDENVNARMHAIKLQNAIAEKITVGTSDCPVECYITSAMGISAFPDNAGTVEGLLRCADIAMYNAKRKNTDNIDIFSVEMQNNLERKIELDNLIRAGIKNDWFYMVYQPQFSLSDKKIRGFEALLRCKTPDGKEISPGEFVPVAESSELIMRIDDYVIKHSLEEFAPFVAKDNPDLILSVNVSAKNFCQANFTYKLVEYISAVNFPTANLEIEITEDCLVNSGNAIINIEKLRAMGIKVALDDFGTGYTSLGNISKMAVNLLKIDRSFIDDLETNPKQLEFIKTVVSVGHSMGCQLITEGVESEKQVSLLKEAECDFIQGYIWGNPVRFEDAKKMGMKDGM